MGNEVTRAPAYGRLRDWPSIRAVAQVPPTSAEEEEASGLKTTT